MALQWLTLLLSTVLLLCTSVHNDNPLDCPNGKLKDHPPWECIYRGPNQCYNDETVCLDGSSNRTHTCAHIDSTSCHPMGNKNPTKAFCSFEIKENYRTHGCSASFKSPMPAKYEFGVKTYRCQIDMSAPPSIKCTCTANTGRGTVHCGEQGGMNKLVQCVDEQTSDKSLACYTNIKSTMLLRHGNIYDDGSTSFVHNLEKCEGTFVRVSANGGGPSPKSLDAGKVWCCTGLTRGIACDHVCYNKAMDKHEVCPIGKEMCYYEKGTSVNKFTSGCSDGKKSSIVVIDKQVHMKCWGKQVATHYICVQYNNIVNSYDKLNKVSSNELVKDALKYCAKALHRIDNVHCIHLPILLPGGENKNVSCAIAMKTDKCDDDELKNVAKKEMCWKYNINGATLKDKANLSAKMAICGKCSKLMVNSKQNPEHFWSGCSTDKPPNGFIGGPKHITITDPSEVAKQVEQCGEDKMFCWKINGVSCIWWQESVNDISHLDCIKKFTAAAGNQINLDRTCMNQVDYAIDKTSGRYVKWQCCNYGTCANNPLVNSGTLCPKHVTTSFTKEELCSRQSVTPPPTTKPEYTEGRGNMAQCSDNDPCSQGVKWDGDDKAVLVVDCQSKIPTDVPPTCSDKAISKPPQWPSGVPVDKASVSVDESVLQLARCIADATCTSAAVSSTETPPTGSTVAPDSEPPQCTAAAAVHKCSAIVQSVILLVLATFVWL